ncbi:hypothetical protein R6Q57_019854 [Mikania cordata]
MESPNPQRLVISISSYLVSLDLPDNGFTGEIMASLRNCSFLNTLVIAGNKLFGTLPVQLYNLGMLKVLVANNDLSDLIPSSLSKFKSLDFDGNNGLCVCGPYLQTSVQKEVDQISARRKWWGVTNCGGCVGGWWLPPVVMGVTDGGVGSGGDRRWWGWLPTVVAVVVEVADGGGGLCRP